MYSAKGLVSETLRPRDKSTPRLFLLNVWNVYKGLRRLRVSKRFRDRLRISYFMRPRPLRPTVNREADLASPSVSVQTLGVSGDVADMVTDVCLCKNCPGNFLGHLWTALEEGRHLLNASEGLCCCSSGPSPGSRNPFIVR